MDSYTVQYGSKGLGLEHTLEEARGEIVHALVLLEVLFVLEIGTSGCPAMMTIISQCSLPTSTYTVSNR
jgi:hypothetical protein